MNNAPRLKAKAYGQGFALTVEAFNKSVARGEVERTVVIEIAAKNPDQTYDWVNKIAFQLELHEMVLMAGLFLGYLPDYQIDRPSRKSLTIVRQRQDGAPHGNYYVKAFQDKKLYNLPITSGDGAFISLVMLTQLSQHSEGIYADGLVLAAIRSACALYAPARQGIPA